MLGPVRDVLRFARLHLPGSGGLASGKALLTPAGIQEMQHLKSSGRQMRIGLGWFRWQRDGDGRPWFVEHLGSGGGFFNNLRIYPDLDLAIAVMGNSTAYDYRRVTEAVLADWQAGRLEASAL
jgi:CubicO group peptidase (beta-lactamase class C family)